MLPARRMPLSPLLSCLFLLCSNLSSHAQGNTVDKYLVKGYDHAATFGSAYVPGQWNPPFGTLEVTQTAGKSGKTGVTGIAAFVDAIAFTSPTTATEVFGVADALGTVSPTTQSFSTPGKVDVAFDGIALYYNLDPISGLFFLTDAEPGTIHLASTLSGPANIDNVHERSTYMMHDGLFNRSLSLKSDLHGRFGYGGAGTASVWFEGFENTVIVPPGTTTNTDDSRFGFIQTGSMTVQK